MNAKPTYASQQLLTNWNFGADLRDNDSLHLILHHGGSTYRWELSPEMTALLRQTLNGEGGAELQQGTPQ